MKPRMIYDFIFKCTPLAKTFSQSHTVHTHVTCDMHGTHTPTCTSASIQATLGAPHLRTICVWVWAVAVVFAIRVVIFPISCSVFCGAHVKATLGAKRGRTIAGIAVAVRLAIAIICCCLGSVYGHAQDDSRRGRRLWRRQGRKATTRPCVGTRTVCPTAVAIAVAVITSWHPIAKDLCGRGRGRGRGQGRRGRGR